MFILFSLLAPAEYPQSLIETTDLQEVGVNVPHRGLNFPVTASMLEWARGHAKIFSWVRMMASNSLGPMSPSDLQRAPF